MSKNGVLIIDDTSIEKFGIQMENISEVRTSKGKINLGYVAFLACVYMPKMITPTACKTWVPPSVEGPALMKIKVMRAKLVWLLHL